MEGRGKGGASVWDLQTWETNWQWVNTSPPPFEYHVATQCTIQSLQFKSMPSTLSPQPANGIVCVLVLCTAPREAEVQHSRVGPWGVLVVLAGGRPPTDFIFIVLPHLSAAPPICPCLHNIQVIPCIRWNDLKVHLSIVVCFRQMGAGNPTNIMPSFCVVIIAE